MANSRIEEILTALINGETIDFTPRSRAEQYLKNCLEGCGCEGLPVPRSRLDALLYSLADKLSGGGGGENSFDAYVEDSTTEVNLPTATKIREKAFYYHQNLTNITMPNVMSIGGDAFNGCPKLALTELPSGLTSIGYNAFYGCPKLALTELPSGVTSIGTYAFSGCTKLALTSLPSGVTSIGNRVFYNCKNLALTSLPSGLTSIGDYAFSGCTSLTTITFKGTPTSINSSAFYQCTNLATINVPWAEGEVANAPWGATNATINYNYTGE